jgi:hypothetical protein
MNKKLEDGTILTQVKYWSGKLRYRYYELNGSYHKEDGPAFIEYREDGSISYQSYWLNNNRHREDGPAMIDYHTDGSINRRDYYLNHKRLNKEEYEAWRMNKEADEAIHEMLEG